MLPIEVVALLSAGILWHALIIVYVFWFSPHFSTPDEITDDDEWRY